MQACSFFFHLSGIAHTVRTRKNGIGGSVFECCIFFDKFIVRYIEGSHYISSIMSFILMITALCQES